MKDYKELSVTKVDESCSTETRLNVYVSGKIIHSSQPFYNGHTIKEVVVATFFDSEDRKVTAVLFR